jgi:hypothetical protein
MNLRAPLLLHKHPRPDRAAAATKGASPRASAPAFSGCGYRLEAASRRAGLGSKSARGYRSA